MNVLAPIEPTVIVADDPAGLLRTKAGCHRPRGARVPGVRTTRAQMPAWAGLAASTNSNTESGAARRISCM